jgi:GNAT superfamily N-acetyltransferase
MDITFRPEMIADAADIADILISVRTEYMPYAPLVHSEADVHRWVAALLIPRGGVTVAIHQSQIVGVASVSRVDGESWIDHMAVLPAHTGMGIGAKLLAHICATLTRPILLHTFQANSGARRFYERFGFALISSTDGAENEERCPDVLYRLGARK